MTAGLARRFSAALLVGFFALCAQASTIAWFGARYSPRDGERPRRARTDFIVLHTTEGALQGSYGKLFARGEAHFLVDRSGRVYLIIRREKVAYHAGCSMWNGRRDLDNCSIGIEAVGHYNESLTDAQYAALRRLLDNLKGTYGIRDDHVLTHSMVAYGEANRWYSTPHRGRKRCGMLFADRTVRARLGLRSQPAYDPDVAARRLTVGDAYLARMLYPSASVQLGGGTPSPSVRGRR